MPDENPPEKSGGFFYIWLTGYVPASGKKPKNYARYRRAPVIFLNKMERNLCRYLSEKGERKGIIKPLKLCYDCFTVTAESVS